MSKYFQIQKFIVLPVYSSSMTWSSMSDSAARSLVSFHFPCDMVYVCLEQLCSTNTCGISCRSSGLTSPASTNSSRHQKGRWCILMHSAVLTFGLDIHLRGKKWVYLDLIPQHLDQLLSYRL